MNIPKNTNKSMEVKKMPAKNTFYDNFVLENGFSVLNLDFSPIKGPQGNIEYLIYMGESPESIELSK